MPIIRHLIIETVGAFVSKHQGRLRVTANGTVLSQAPLLHLESVLLLGKGIALSTDVVAACATAGIPIYMMDALGRPYGSLYAAGLTGTVRTRRAQLIAYYDAKAAIVGRTLISAKLQNQVGLLRYMAKYRKESEPTLYERVRAAMTEMLVWENAVTTCGGATATVDDLREPLMVVEAHAARHYWAGVAALLPPTVPWPGRRGRAARDPVNSVLNYGYGVLYNEIERAIVLAGLDPYAGFLHADRPGKYSLVLDLIEPFRAPVVDRAILNYINKGGTIAQDDKGWLDTATRKAVAERVKERLARATPHEGQQIGMRHLVQQQARALASFLRGDTATFTAYVARW